MIRSMTAFGRAEKIVGNKEIVIEMKSVNNRFADISVRLPRNYSFLEDKITAYVQTHGISRGKVDINCTVNALSSENGAILLDSAYAESYITALRELRDRFGLTDDISVMTVARNPDLFLQQRVKTDIDSEFADLCVVLDEALQAFFRMREIEGSRLRDDLLAKCENLRGMVKTVSDGADRAQELYRKRLENKLTQVLADYHIEQEIDRARIVTECAIFADKTAIDEEIVRLSSHIDTLAATLNADEPVGRKLDFLMQEMNRETNTIGSKVSDLALTSVVVDIKTELEKIREQIQNLE